jgi:DNA-binding transcriptional MerR regulator
MTESVWRIGELSRRVGVSTQVLRAWEARYGLLEPRRSAGGYRLYSERDEARVRRVLAYRAQGLSTAEAARMAATTSEAANSAGGGEALASMRDQLLDSLVRVDETAAQAALDRLFAAVDLDSALVGGVLPVLAAIGERWARGQSSVGAEHFATNIIQARLLALARGWDEGIGRQALLACAPGELHTIGLLAFGLLLRRRGWRVVYLGASTPVDSLRQWVRAHRPDVVVVSAVAAVRLYEAEAELRDLASDAPLRLGGAGASTALAQAVEAQALEADPLVAAERLSEAMQ